MKNILQLLLLAAVLTGCQSTVTAVDSQGREFVRVRERKEHADGTADAELWQRVGATGNSHQLYLRLMTPKDSPPMFTTAP